MVLFFLSSSASSRAELQAAIDAAAAARRQTTAAVARADAADAFAAGNQVLLAQAESERRAAVTQRDHWKSRFTSASLVAPDTCAPVILAADSAISSAEKAAAASEVKVALLQASVDSLRSAYAILRPPVINLVAATAKLEHVAKPKFALRRGPALSVGVDPTGAPRLTLGFSLCWCK